MGDMNGHLHILAVAAWAAMAVGLCSCGPNVSASEDASTASALPPLSATYDVSIEDAWRATSASFPGLGERAAIEDVARGCAVRLDNMVAVKVCSSGGKVGQVTVTARTPDADVAKGIAAITSIISPEADPREQIRVNAEAKKALAAGKWTSLCPDVRCFKITPLGASWQLVADAGAA